MSGKKMEMLVRRIVILCFCSLSIFLSGCASIGEDWKWDDSSRRWMWAHEPYAAEPKVPEDAWVFGKKEINFQIEAVQRLNAYKEESHTAVVKIYQLSDTSAFNQLIQTPSGIRHLLKADELDPSILFVDKRVIKPNASQQFSVDRQDGARYIGIIVGFSNLNAKASSRIISIVGMDDSLRKNILTRTKQRVLGSPDPARPAKLSLEVWLGSESIERTIVKAS